MKNRKKISKNNKKSEKMTLKNYKEYQLSEGMKSIDLQAKLCIKALSRKHQIIS